jgi:hypothetical protein
MADRPIPPKFRLIRFRDVRPSTGRNYLVKGLIPRSGLVVIYGKPKSGKSFFATDLFAHIALGWEYRGRRVSQGACVYVACEGHSGFPTRLEAFRLHHLAEAADRDGIDKQLIGVPLYYVAANLDLVADRAALVQAIRFELGDTAPAAVVIDTLNRSLNGSESKDEDMGKYLRAAGAIIDEFSCVVAVVHHTGIDTTRPRGHTSLTGAADAQIRVERDDADNVVATVEWMKDGPEGDQIVSRLDLVEVGTDEDGDPLTTCVVIPANGQSCVSTGSKQRRLTKAGKNALRALNEAMAAAGEPAPKSTHIPQTVTVTTLEVWRDYAYRMGISASQEPRAKQTAFKRASELLIRDGFVAEWDPYVWLAK